MNFFDRLIGFFSPVNGLRRAYARAALRTVDVLQRKYEGAKTGRRTDGWTATNTSANSEIAPAWSKLVARSRDLVRNSGYARKAVSTFVRHMVRTGVRAEWSNPGVQKMWDSWALECDFNNQLDLYGLESLAVRTWKESGACLVRFHVEPSMDVPLKLQLLEPDHIDMNKNEAVGTNGNFTFMGIEFDRYGRRVAYWLFPSHPGESLTMGMHGLVSQRVPADEVIHLYSIDRPGQVHGVPQLAVSIMKARDLDDYEEAELLRKKIEACFVAVVTKPYNADGIGEEQEQTDGTNTRLEKVRPASFVYTRYGEDVKFGAPSSSQGYGEYTKTQLHAIAAGSDVTYEQMTGDLSGVNYSSIREGKLEFRALIEMEQELTFIPLFCRAVARKFAEIGYIRGKLRPHPDNASVEWTTPKIDWIDMLKEVMATKEEIKGCMKSISESLRERGYSPKKVFKEIAEERKLLEELGLTPDVVLESMGEQPSASEPAPAEDATDGATDGQEPAVGAQKASCGVSARDVLLHSPD